MEVKDGMSQIIEKTNDLLRSIKHEDKGYALHYLWGYIKSSASDGQETISYSKLIEVMQDALNQTF